MTEDPDTLAIREVIANWIRASAAGDLDGILRLMSEDVVFLLPGRLPMRGKASFAAAFNGSKGKMQVEGQPAIQEIEVFGHFAYCWSFLSLTLTPIPAGSVMSRAGHVLSIFRKEPDGKWVLYRDANLMATL